ncbi:MAG: peptidoglycan DD-metalloendopeptidase family protein [Prolixibacteraceae bacterium]|nr:peptidoglycan DD-metalloendopeptidase family protein [Prolixibacteraceae bacterium]
MKKYIIELFIVIIAILLIALAIQGDEEKVYEPGTPLTVEEPIVEIKRVWGLPLDDFVSIDTLTIRYGQNLSDILRPKGISAFTIDRIARTSKEIFDVRKVKAGKPYYLLNNDTTAQPELMIYEETVSDYVVFDLDSGYVYTGKKEIDSVRQVAGGIIETSLWNAFSSNGASPVLAVELSDIFAWTIDFFGIQPGDQFRVIYDALYVEDKYAGIGKIHAASITHRGETITGYYYKDSIQEGYFDNEGNSLQKAFLKAPLKFSRISSRYSNSRFHPVLKIRRPHRGVDYAAPTGTPVYSIGDGTVVKKGYQRRGGGNYINVKHNSVYTSQYMHLNSFASGMAPGVRVKQGQLIGYVGSSGLSTGPHLDFRIYKNGSAVDPLKVDAPPIEPINEANRADFNVIRDSLRSEIGNIIIEPEDQKLAVEN